MKKQTKFETDNFTRGGQLTTHKWRMRLQNLKASSTVSIYVALGVILVSALFYQPSWWLLKEFYLGCYLPAWIKILTWNMSQPFFIELDKFLRGLLRGSEGLPWAYQTVSQMTTKIYLKDGSFKIINTLRFLSDGHVSFLAFQVHRILLWGVGAFLVTVVTMNHYFSRASRKIEEDQIVRGKEVVSLRDLRRQVLKAGISKFVIAPGLPLPAGSENQHTAIMGATRMGKTTCLIHLLKQVREKNERAVILDSTGELTDKFYRPDKDHLINPLDPRSECWNIWDEQLEPYGYDAWAAGVIPDGKGDPFWHMTSRNLLSATARKLTFSSDRSMSELLNKACLAPMDDDLAQFYEDTEAASVMSGSAERMSMGVRQQLAGYISAFRHLKTDKPPFSVTDWVKNTKDSGEWLFLMAKPDQRSTLAPLVASLFNFAFLGLERAGVDFKNRLWMAADEIAGWDFQITGLKRMVTEGAKYGACCVLGFQNKSQIDALYSHAGTKTLLSNCSTKVIFRSQDHETAKDLSLTLGEQEVLSSSEGFSMGAHHMRDGVNLSEQRRVQPTIPATEIMSLNKLEAYVLLPGNFPATKVKFNIPA